MPCCVQELYSAYTSHVHRTAIVIHSPDPGGATCVCRLCEHLVLAEMLQGHTQICRIVSQCKTIVACADGTLAKVLCKLNAATNSSIMAGQSGSQASLVLELFRAFTSALLAVTAAPSNHPTPDPITLRPTLMSLTLSLTLPLTLSLTLLQP